MRSFQFLSIVHLRHIFAGLFSCFFMLGLGSVPAFAADSDLDGNYMPAVSSSIFSIVSQPDGKAVIAGQFTTVNTQARRLITRLNVDGTLDSTFSPTINPNGTVQAVVRQPDGRFLIGGQFTAINGTVRMRIARLNTDGSIDTSFDSSVGANNQVICLALQADGKILVGGDFTTYNNIAHTYMARLNSDGTLDNTFNASLVTATSAGAMRVIVPVGDGTIYIGGGFASVSGISRQFIARLNADGSLDTAFNPGNGANSFVEAIQPVNGGQILVGGSFTNINSTARNALVRLNANGSVDATFNAALNQSSITYNIVPQASGKILISGSILGINGIGRRGIERINGDGSSDASFNVNAGTNGTINATAIQPDGRILIGGQFVSYNGITQAPLARLVGTPVTTAAESSIAGRVITGNGKGLANARVELTGTGGSTITVTTNSFGYFTFESVESGATYIIGVSAKKYTFAPQVVSLTNNISGLTFTAQ